MLVTALLLVGAGVANAQTNYPLESTLELRDGDGGSIADGACVGAEIKVRATGWRAGADIRAEYFSDAVQLGIYKADANGQIAFSFNVPDAPPVPGTHTFRLSGAGANGADRTLDAEIKCLGHCDQTAVAANTVSRADANAKVGSQSTFGRTGALIGPLAAFAFALLMIGLVLVLGVRKRRAALAR